MNPTEDGKSTTVMHDPRQQADGFTETWPQSLVLNSARRAVERTLLEATAIYRDDDQPLTADEQLHADRWAAIVVALMGQREAKAASIAMEAAVDQVLQSVANESRAFNEDHSAHYAIEQAIDRVIAQIRSYNIPLALLSAMEKSLGLRR